jgi:phosphoglycerate dehydrogenase-like enzyme
MDVLITHGPYLADRADHVLSNAPKLKWIQGIGTGVDNFADRPVLRDDVMVTNIHGVHGNPMSEAAFGAMLALSRKIPRSVRNQDRQKWESWPSRLITGKTIGIFGIGSIALTVAPRCKAFDMTVIGISSAPREVAGFDRMVHRDDLIEAVRELDYFLLLTPYSPETHNIIDARVFAAMKSQSFLINHARGGVMDEAALLAALREPDRGRGARRVRNRAAAAGSSLLGDGERSDHLPPVRDARRVSGDQPADHRREYPQLYRRRHRRDAQRGAPGEVMRVVTSGTAPSLSPLAGRGRG